MSELTVALLRFGLLALLWLFVFSVVGVMRADLYVPRVVTKSRRSGSSSRTPSERPASALPRRARGRVPSALAVVEGPLTGTTVPLRESGTILGRAPECALVLEDDFASGRHARLFADAGRWYVEDLGSTNGTFLVDGSGETRVTRATEVGLDSTLRIGKTVLKLRR